MATRSFVEDSIVEIRAQAIREVPGLIRSQHEWTYWDFKREWYEDSNDLFHDILCMANNLDWHPGYIIIGVDDRTYEVVDVNGDPHRRTTQSITDQIGHASWAGGYRPQVFVMPMTVEDKMIDVVIVVQRHEEMPYYLEKSRAKLRANCIYTRRNDTNTPIDEAASRPEVEKLWAHHFGLDLSPLLQLPRLLRDKDSWEAQSQLEATGTWYYRYAPEYTLSKERDDDSTEYEYYMVNQCDSRPHWKMLRIFYYQTQLFDCQAISLDGWRYFTPLPDRSFYTWPGEDPSHVDVDYCYFEMDSLEWCLHEFFYSAEDSEQRIAHDKFLKLVPVFHGERERKDFEGFIGANRYEFEKRVGQQKEPYLGMLPDRYLPTATGAIALQIKQALVIIEMLDEYRAGRSNDPRICVTTDW